MKKTFSSLKEGDILYELFGSFCFRKSTIYKIRQIEGYIEIYTGQYSIPYYIPLNHSNATQVKSGNTMIFISKKRFKKAVMKKLNEVTK